MTSNISRRSFLKAAAVGAGALAGARLGGRELIGSVRAATTEPTTVVMVYLEGGINAIFTGADAFTNSAFGVTGDNVVGMGPVVVDATLGNAIPQGIRNRVASCGVRNITPDHSPAQRGNFTVNNQSAPLILANAIGGTGAIKAAVVGDNSLPDGQRPNAVNGVSLQPVTDMRATIEALAGATPAANVVDRDGALKGLTAAQTMSKQVSAKHPGSLVSVADGYGASIATLAKPVQPFNVQEFNQAYGINGAGINGFSSKMAAAELMVRSGTGVVIARERQDWDTHGDSDGSRARDRMGNITRGLSTFLTRMVQNASAERNVVVAIFGDFHRDLPGSNHQSSGAALVIGKTLKNATTGKTDGNARLGPETPGIAGLWQLLAAAAKVDNSPFGANPHTALMA